MKRTRVLVWLALVALLIAGCKKEGAGSGVAALLTKDVASRLSKDVLVFAESLPADTQVFGYLDLGRSIDSLSQGVFSPYRGALDDLLAMTKRRFGVDVSKVSGAGLVVIARKPVFLLPLALPGGKAPSLGDNAPVRAMAMGPLTAIGEPDGLAALEAARKGGKALYKAHPAWVKGALTHGAGNLTFVSANVAALLKDAPGPVDPPMNEVTYGTLVLGKRGVASFVACTPGGATKVRAFLENGLDVARGEAEREAQALSSTEFGPLASALLRRYNAALFQSIKLAVTGDEVSVALTWRAPELPKVQPAPPLSERLIAKDEWAVAQVNFGGPMIDLVVALTDVLGTPIDRPAVVADLVGAAGKALGVLDFNPRAITVSAGASSILASVHTKVSGLPQEPVPAAGGALAALVQPWGVALALADQAPALVEAAATPGQPLALLASSKLGGGTDAAARIFVDATRLPPQLIPNLPVPVSSVEMLFTSTSFTAEVVALPGQAGALTGPIAQAKDAITAQAALLYKNREQGPVQLEVMAIMQHHQAQLVAELLTPKVQGDRLTFALSFPAVQMQLVGGAALVGVLGAIAIPALMDYQAKAVGQHLQQLEAPDPTQDPTPPQEPAQDPAAPQPAAP